MATGRGGGGVKERCSAYTDVQKNKIKIYTAAMACDHVSPEMHNPQFGISVVFQGGTYVLPSCSQNRLKTLNKSAQNTPTAA